VSRSTYKQFSHASSVVIILYNKDLDDNSIFNIFVACSPTVKHCGYFLL